MFIVCRKSSPGTIFTVGIYHEHQTEYCANVPPWTQKEIPTTELETRELSYDHSNMRDPLRKGLKDLLFRHVPKKGSVKGFLLALLGLQDT